MTVEPGRQLAGRYRVEDLLAERAGARLWRAVDEVLRRSVAVDVLPADAPQATALVQAARRAAVVTDGRFLRVLDAAEENGDVYVVREWARGETLERVLADGPLTHRRAAWVVHEVAEAMASAHSAGIHHLKLVPDNILVTDTGGVKIIGLATDAALHGVEHADAEDEDVRALGRLLYASLVARWPGGSDCTLPAAPVEHGRLLRPAQVRAGVPRHVDAVCDRILGDPPAHKAEPLRHASAIATELDATARLGGEGGTTRDPEATQGAGFAALSAAYEPTSSLHAPDQTLATPRVDDRDLRSPEPQTQRTAAHQPVGGGAETTRQIPAMAVPVPSSPVPSTSAPHTRAATTAGVPPAGTSAGEPHAGGRSAWVWVAAAAVVAALAVVAFFLGFNSDNGRTAGAATPKQPPTPSTQPLRPVPVSSVTAFDPFGESGENDDQARLAIDGDASTQWTTLSYEGNPEFGGLKPGLGLVLDLGRPSTVRRVTLAVGGSGTDLELRAARAAASSAPQRPGDFRTVATVDNASGHTVLRPARPVSTRFLLVWLTSLPPEGGGTFAGSVHEIAVHG